MGHFVFSSSATVYGDLASVPIREDFPLSTTNPYGTTKLMIERIPHRLRQRRPEFPPGAAAVLQPPWAPTRAAKIGEDPNGIPNNLVPLHHPDRGGQAEKVHVFGNDYPTPDGTGVRDYIHVVGPGQGPRRRAAPV